MDRAVLYSRAVPDAGQPRRGGHVAHSMELFSGGHSVSDSLLNLADALRTATYWVLFFATSVYGHVALKAAVARARSGSAVSVLGSGLSWLGVSAYAAWGVSCLCWMLVLSRCTLLRASSISSLSYVMVCASAVLFLDENLTAARAIGVFLIAGGILLIK